MQFGMLWQARLNKERRGIGIDTYRQPIDHHVPHALFDDAGVFVMRGQRMPIGHEEKAFIFGL